MDIRPNYGMRMPFQKGAVKPETFRAAVKATLFGWPCHGYCLVSTKKRVVGQLFV